MSATTNLNIPKLAFGTTGWEVTTDNTFDLLDGLASLGGALAVAARNVTADTLVSTSLFIKVSAGTYEAQNGTQVSYAGTASQAVTASLTNYVYLTDAGTLTVNTSGFPASTAIVPLATVLCGVSAITAGGITDKRTGCRSYGANLNTVYLALAGGTFSDGGGVVGLNLGTTNGVKVGTAVGQKLGFWNATPVAQPSGANQAALTDSTGGTAGFTIANVTASFSQSVLNNNFASVVRLINQLRSDIVTTGLIKGSA